MLRETRRAKDPLEMTRRACRVVNENVDRNGQLTVALLNIMPLKCQAADVNHNITMIVKLNFVSVNNHLQQLGYSSLARKYKLP